MPSVLKRTRNIEMIDISDLLDDSDSQALTWDADCCSGTFINFEGKLIPLDDNLPIGVL